MSDSRTALPRASFLWSRACIARVCRPAQFLQVSAFHFFFGMSLCLWSLLVLGEFRATCSVVKNKIIPFVILSLRPIFCSFDTSLSSLIPDINWSSHLLQYSRLLLCFLTRPFQAVTYSLSKNSFNSHEVYLQVFVVTSLTLVIVKSRARGFRVLHYQRWRNGKLPKPCLWDVFVPNRHGPLLLLFLRQKARCRTIRWARTNPWTSE